MLYDYTNPVDNALLRIWVSLTAHRLLDGREVVGDSDGFEYLQHYADEDFRLFYRHFRSIGGLPEAGTIVLSPMTAWLLCERAQPAGLVVGHRALAEQYAAWRLENNPLAAELENEFIAGSEDSMMAQAKAFVRQGVAPPRMR